jgi:S-adenosylmethionine synthetase
MRTAYFTNPNHPNKICDIAAESVVQLYTNTNELYYSDVFSYMVNNILYVRGWVSADTHFSYNDITKFILTSIGVDIDIIVDIEQNKLSDNIVTIHSGTFLGYSTNENIQGIPFEQLEVMKLTKFISDSINEPLRIQITINGNAIEVGVETNYNDQLHMENLINDYLKNKGYMQKIIKICNMDDSVMYKSGENFISNTYGPRSPYGNTNFIGLDINRNLKYTHLVAKEIADKHIINVNLNYALVELTYANGNENPIQFGIKGNQGGIHIENGTFFENSIDYQRLINTKNSITQKIKSNPTSLVEMAKWGYFNYK